MQDAASGKAEREVSTLSETASLPGRASGTLIGPRTFGWHVVAMAFGLLVPALILIAILIMQFAASERARVESGARAHARTLAVSVGHKINDTITTLQALTTTPTLDAGDQAALYDQLQKLRGLQNQHFSLRSADGVTVLATRLPFGETIPDNRQEVLEADLAALERRRPFVSDIFVGPVSRRPNIQIVVPVLQHDPPRWLMGASMELEIYQRLLESFERPDGWTIALLDGANNLVARSPDLTEAIGKPVSQIFQNAAKERASLFYGVNTSGVPALVAYDTEPVSGWRVVVSVPKPLVNERLYRSILTMLAGWALLGGIGFALAWTVRQRLAQAVSAVGLLARSIREGTPVARPASAVTDIDHVAEVLYEASQDLRASEYRLRHILDNLFVFVGFCEPGGVLRECNRPPLDAAGISRSDVIGKPFWQCYWWNHAPAVSERIRLACEAAAGGETLRFDIPIRVKDNGRMLIDFQIAPLRDKDGAIIGIQPSGVDVTQREEAQEHQRFLLREIAHRSKNQLTVIQAMATQTARQCSSIDEFVRGFLPRLHGLSVATDVLVAQDWKGAPLHDLVRAQVAAFVPEDGRIVVRGPDLRVTGDAAQAIGLALHELATNAVKHGAWSCPSGIVTIEWAIDPTGRDAPWAPLPVKVGEAAGDAHGAFATSAEPDTDVCLRLAWRESGGPPVPPPTRKGFGQIILERLAAQRIGGDVEMTFAPAGLCWLLRARGIVSQGAG
jgi:PAS domain S-box-containing protein